MNPANHYEDTPSETLKRLADDVWYKTDALTKRVAKLEGEMAGVMDWKTNLDGPPGNYQSGILGRMNDSLRRFNTYLDQQAAVEQERSKEASGRWWKTALGAGAVLFIFNVLWSILKAKIGLG